MQTIGRNISLNQTKNQINAALMGDDIAKHTFFGSNGPGRT